MLPLKHVVTLVTSLVGILAMVLLVNLQFSLLVGDPQIPSLDDRWWGGYMIAGYDTLWCLARFKSSPGDGPVRMAVLMPGQRIRVFDGRRSSSDRTFVKLSLTDSISGTRLALKQLYKGQRYFLGRLMAGRFRDFWKQNVDVAIRGQVSGAAPPALFAIEPVSNSDILNFYSDYVDPSGPTTDLLAVEARLRSELDR